ncbi:YbfB/YjiJ family MFS transporter [Cupriavidus sp. 2SB]|uniref:YbfB/YjiJ family MFS transporter n=1 Tax=Cupriavidus sp. 2SB TaxID=2502199 RepID=UPI0010F5A604|nr:YbfB/YjiJ family MFS transporter [Cupriavidus sp. 2SB]
MEYRTVDSTSVGGTDSVWPKSERGEGLVAALALAISMGFGRFAFTGMYPLMVRDGVVSVSTGSVAASANYAGYLVGALLASRIPHRNAGRCAQLALIATTVCIAILALAMPPEILAFVRFIAGIASALGLICSAVWLLQVRARHHGSPLMFSGVGLGILISAELIALGNVERWHSSYIWWVLAAGAVVLLVPAWRPLRLAAITQHDVKSDTAPVERHLLTPGVLIASYGLAGFGYIITATYLPLFVRDALGSIDPVHVWAAFGLGAAPSCFLWHALHERLGTRRSLQLNLLIQAVGVALPVVSHSAAGYLASALLVGGTFMGTVTIVMPAAKRVAHTVKFNLFAVMTAAYGVGQILGPIASSWLVHAGHGFNPSLEMAAFSLVVAAIVCLL